MTAQFNTVQYCIDNAIPCFTTQLTAEKRPGFWKHITIDEGELTLDEDVYIKSVRIIHDNFSEVYKRMGYKKPK